MNCKKGEIVEYEVSDRMILYTFHLADQSFSEFDRFISRFDVTGLNDEGNKLQEDLIGGNR